ncbi:uncharacterized protein LOC111366415 [Olea europaea var. sylvestris]|uniref:uncharacterized protein LOC111366415 n=1 Tax=Olea europaea var. sylvestris TaxID=158386 RepID=UPI000C1D8018|nr:uncharacterized protein LOC111366415 [Olea europaea var. sylvestris]
MKSILCGVCEFENIQEACLKLTKEFFRDDTLLVLILCLPKLNLEMPLKCKGKGLIAYHYLEVNLAISEILLIKLNVLICLLTNLSVVGNWTLVLILFCIMEDTKGVYRASDCCKNILSSKHPNFDVGRLLHPPFKVSRMSLIAFFHSVADYLENYVHNYYRVPFGFIVFSGNMPTYFAPAYFCKIIEDIQIREKILLQESLKNIQIDALRIQGLCPWLLTMKVVVQARIDQFEDLLSFAHQLILHFA